jgi:hypothetical protein
MNYDSLRFRAVVLAPDDTVDMGLAFANRYGALYRKFNLCILINEAAQSPNSYIHVPVSDQDKFAYLAAAK